MWPKSRIPGKSEIRCDTCSYLKPAKYSRPAEFLNMSCRVCAFNKIYLHFRVNIKGVTCQALRPTHNTNFLHLLKEKNLVKTIA